MARKKRSVVTTVAPKADAKTPVRYQDTFQQNVGKKGFTTEERGGFQAFVDAGFIDTFRQIHPDRTGAYTWWTQMANARARNVGWRIDYFLTSAALRDKIADADVHMDIMGSDHCPVSLVLSS